MKENYLTRAGREKLHKELDRLRKRRAELRDEIAEARENLDLREAPESHPSKQALAEVLLRIGQIEDELASARLIEDLDIKGDEVRIGVKVTLREKRSRRTAEWTLVGAPETDPGKGRIAVDAPLAQALLGRKQGDEVEARLPAGPKSFKILKIEPPGAGSTNGQA